MAVADVGVQVTCPGCSQTVMQKAMIPVLGAGNKGMAYRCRTCARGGVVVRTETPPEGTSPTPPPIPAGEAPVPAGQGPVSG